MRITLASTSPRRRELIKKLGLQVDFVSPECDENIDCIAPAACAETLAERKAMSVNVGGVIIGADTVVAVDGSLLGKPKSREDALDMLKKLSGRAHEVVTGLCVISGEKKLISSITTTVTFGSYDAAAAEAYADSGKCFDKAGGYGIQDEEIKRMITCVDGDIDNVIGLPIALLRKMIDEVTKEIR